MCRQGGYHDQAVFLSKKHGEHDRVVDILIEDSKKYNEALDYIHRHEPDVAYPNLMRYARVLLEHCPEETTQLFIEYYTGQYRLKKDSPVAPIQVPKPRTAFSSFVDHPDQFIVFLEACLDETNMDESDKVDLHTTLFEIYLDIAGSKTGQEKQKWEAKAKTLIDGHDVSVCGHTPSLYY